MSEDEIQNPESELPPAEGTENAEDPGADELAALLASIPADSGEVSALPEDANAPKVVFAPMPDLENSDIAGASLSGDGSLDAAALIPDSLVSGEELGAAAAGLAEEPLADENSNPAIAVDEMLSAAVLDDASLSSGLLDEPAGSDTSSAPPQFQLFLQVPKGAQREELKKAATELGLTLDDAVWAADVPLISQLTEFQAVRLTQCARALDMPFTADVMHPHQAPSEEDLALGGLASVPDAAPVQVEGAPAVRLPGTERAVLLYSGDSFPGFPVLQSLGPVTAHRSIARRLFREEELEEKMRRELERVPGRGAANFPKSRLEALFRELFLDLQKASLSLGGNAVMGVRIEAFPESSHLDPSLEQIRLVAFGTGAVVEKVDP